MSFMLRCLARSVKPKQVNLSLRNPRDLAHTRRRKKQPGRATGRHSSDVPLLHPIYINRKPRPANARGADCHSVSGDQTQCARVDKRVQIEG
jgi:hypothetical protein